MRLIVTRHGQTPWNTEHRVQGHTDIPLDARGHAQAEALAQRLAAMRIAAVYTSPLQRARETGAHIAEVQHCPLVEDARLLERYFGEWEGHRLQDLRTEYPALWDIWLKRPAACPVPGAETMDAVFARASGCVDDLLAAHAQDDTVVVISHANPVKLLIAHYMHISFNDLFGLRTDNCSYTELSDREGVMRVNTLNEISFLQERGLL